MAVRIGTSGWHYAEWKELVYPAGLPKSQWLRHLSRQFETIELNSSFYRLPGRESFEQWADQVPPDFVFAVKASRYLTHVRRLKEPEEAVERLLSSSDGLGSTSGPFLLQLPPNLPIDIPALGRTLAAFGPRRRVAVEPRHPSWDTDEVRSLLESRGAACCWSDRRGHFGPRWKTTDWGYVRLHEGRAAPETCYGRRALASAARELSECFAPAEDVFVYFNNDRNGCAVQNARLLRHLISRFDTAGGAGV
jgi:uncharacterized protein YecE (DUF72 family)